MEDTHPGKSIPLAATSLLNNTAFFATLKASAAFMRWGCDFLE